MTHNIEGFEEYFAKIKTKSFYKKYDGNISINNKVKVIAETEKAILIRERNCSTEKYGYSTSPMWISKSKIINLEVI